MEEQLITLLSNFGPLSIAAALVVILTAIIKRYSEVNPRYISAGLCALAGLIYALIKTFVPMEIINHMAAFALLVFGFATSVYKLSK